MSKRVLTNKQVLWAYRKWCEGYTQGEIAQALYVSRALVCRELKQIRSYKVREPLVYKEE